MRSLCTATREQSLLTETRESLLVAMKIQHTHTHTHTHKMLAGLYYVDDSLTCGSWLTALVSHPIGLST